MYTLFTMGFFVNEEITFANLGINVAGCYVTIRASFAHTKAGNPLPGFNPIGYDNSGNYTLTAKYYVYSANEIALKPLKEDFISISEATVPSDPIQKVYDEIKLRVFPGKTFTDDA